MTPSNHGERPAPLRKVTGARLDRGRGNQQTERLFGYQRAELEGAALEVLVPERHRGVHPAHRGAYAREPRMRPMGLDLMARRKDGSEFPVDISLSPLATDHGTVVAAVIRDITERKRAAELERANQQLTASVRELERRNQEITLVNELGDLLQSCLTPTEVTEVIERFVGRLFPEQPGALFLRSYERLAVLVIDLDGFKDVNDALGHHSGDRILLGVAPSLEQHVRGGDLACRYGGDEFVVVLTACDLAGAVSRGEKLRRAVSGTDGGHESGALAPTTVSVGVAAFPQHGASPRELIAAADAALYAAKAMGRNRLAVPEERAEAPA